MTVDVENLELEELLKQLPPVERQRVDALTDALRNFIKAGGPHALIALAIVGTEEGNKGG